MIRVAIPTKGDGGLENVVSDVFGKAKSFTIVDMDDDVVKSVEVLKNPAVSYRHGAGPIVVKMLVDSGVNVVLSSEFGPGASALLEHHHVMMIKVKSCTVVSGAIRNVSWSAMNVHI